MLRKKKDYVKRGKKLASLGPLNLIKLRSRKTKCGTTFFNYGVDSDNRRRLGLFIQFRNSRGRVTWARTVEIPLSGIKGLLNIVEETGKIKALYKQTKSRWKVMRFDKEEKVEEDKTKP